MKSRVLILPKELGIAGALKGFAFNNKEKTSSSSTSLPPTYFSLNVPTGGNFLKETMYK
jgi:hypothetical protein